MKITPNYQYQPQFKAHNHFAELTKKLPNTMVCKNMTLLDKNCLISYLCACQYRLHNCEEEIKKLLKLDGDEFINSAYDFLCNKLEIPEALRPMMENYPTPNPDPLGYLPTFSVIFKNADLSMYSKAQQFGFLRHELQHLIQNLMVLRHEKLGPEAVEFYTNNRTNSTKETIKYHLANGMSAKELAELGDGGDEIELLFGELYKHYHSGDETAFEEIFDIFRAPIREEIESLRKLAVKTMGEIKEDTREGLLAEIYFEDFKYVNYHNPDGKIDFGKYMTTSIETDAMIAGDVAGFDAAGAGCLYKVYKDNALATLANTESEEYKSLEKAAREKIKKFNK